MSTDQAQDLPRIDGSMVWLWLTEAEQRVIGAIAIELAATWRGLDAEDEKDDIEPTPTERALTVADRQLMEMLQEHVELVLETAHVPPGAIPSLIGGVCRRCGCTENDACDGGCSWAEADLCSACAPKAGVRS